MTAVFPASFILLTSETQSRTGPAPGFTRFHSTEAMEYLEEHVKVSAVEILAVLCDLRLVEVPDDVWKQILDADRSSGY